jgi:beta-N-acetylhexosaminidase
MNDTEISEMDVSSLSLEAKVGQLFVAGFDGTRATGDITELITEHHLGSVIYFSRNVESPSQLRRLSAELRECVPDDMPPLCIAIDQEGGRVARISWETELPSAMTIGAADDAALATSAGRAVGHELRTLGIDLNLAPVLDVNNNPDNPVIGVRSFGEQPAAVARLGTGFVAGLQKAGVMACGKHFPGHGDTTVDSHLDLPSIEHDRDRLDRVELRPFRAAIDTGIASLMTAHVAFPATDETERPATLSERVITDLLREELGFDGLVISDCMEMDAISERIGTSEGAVQAIRAGCDLIIVSHTPAQQRAAIDSVVEAVKSDRISEERVNASVRRVLRAKYAYDTAHVGTAADWETAAEKCRSARQTVAEQGVTLVRSANHLPLSKDKPIDVYEFSGKSGSPAEGTREQERDDTFGSILSTAGMTVNQSTLDPADGRSVPLPNNRLTVVCTANAAVNPEQADIVRCLIEDGIDPVVVATRSPYDLSAFPDVGTYLATYDDTRPSLAAAAAVLIGDRNPTGRLPVTIPDADT